MTCTDKIILAFVIVQVAVVLAKPYEPENDDGLNQLNDDMDNSVYKRTESCSVSRSFRKDCGHGGISKQQCESKGCCFDDSIRGAPWCFEPADCGSGCNWDGCFYRKCRSSCRLEETHFEKFDNKCSGADKCCMDHVGKHNAWPQMG